MRGLLRGLRWVMIFLICPHLVDYAGGWANAECELLFPVYLICSWKRIFKLRPVWTTYDRYQVLHVDKFPICCEVECCGPIEFC
jgi:hypothetical protein